MPTQKRMQRLVLVGVLISCCRPSSFVKAEWLEDTCGGQVWHETRSEADLDADVAQGAMILTYADGSYVQAIQRQWGGACAHNSFATILKKMGFADPDRNLCLPADVDDPPGALQPKVDLRYPGSEEHLMYLWTRRQRMHPRYRYWSAKDTLFISLDGALNTKHPDAWLYQYSNGDWGQGWANFMNYVLHQDLGYGAFDARLWGPDPADRSDIAAYRRIIKGFVDHDIPLLVLVRSDKHFNVIIGYRGRVDDTDRPFYVYTTETGPGHWRRIDASGLSVAAGMIRGIGLWNHHLNGGCEPDGWAWQVDQENGSALLCGYAVNPEDPLTLPEGVSNVASINLTGGDTGLSTTSDGLYAVFSSARPGMAQSGLFEATRTSVTSEWEAIELIGKIQSLAGDIEPCVRADGLEMCFASKRPGDHGGWDIWRTRRARRQDMWSEPVPIADINSKWGEAGPCLSADGKRIYFHSGRSGAGDIFVAERIRSDGPFGPPVRVTSLNTSFGDFAPCVSPDEKIIYFASNRPGGEGNIDIWKATRPGRDADWSDATNLSVINTAGREFSPWLEAATGLIYFEADRQIGYGRKDIYVWDEHSTGPPLDSYLHP